jgi:hypothetical protein
MSDPPTPTRYGAAGIEGSEPDWPSDEGRSERARAANEFQIVADVPAKVRTNMRYRSIATLCLFGTTSIVALKYPYVGLGICCCCLIGYRKPDAPGTEPSRKTETLKKLTS